VNRKRIALFTSTEGHISIADAIQESLSAHHEVIRFQERPELCALYMPLYQFFPSAHKLPYALSKREAVVSLLNSTFKKKYHKKLTSFVAEHKPDVFISTYFMFNPTLEQLQQEQGIPFINVLADPKSIHPLFVSPTAISNIVFNQESKEIFESYPQSETAHSEAMGWFVRERFEKTYNKKEVRKRLGLDPELPTFLMASGSDGTTHILKVLPTLLFNDRPLQVIVACGHNHTMYKSVQALKKLLAKTKDEKRLIALKFVTNGEEYMQAADLVIGKAGPNTIFESVATLTPFFAITHIAGQEDGNLDLIRHHNLGFVEELNESTKTTSRNSR
jgi:processive 1,2-diacylglycerol beta-glucosyltransferase